MDHRDPPVPAAVRVCRRRLLVAGGLAVSGVLVTRALGGGGVEVLANSTPLLGPSLPNALSCAGWRAREPSEPLTELPHRPSRIIVHHTATANREDPLTLEVLARAIQDYHMDINHWPDSGHHFLVNRSGLVAEGRHRSLAALLSGRRMVEGTHCRNQNETSIGVENEGTYTEADPPRALLAGLRGLLAFACLQYRLKPAQIGGHRDYADTACPGDRLYALMPSVRAGVARLLGVRGTSPGRGAPTWPLTRIADRGPTVQAAQHLLRAAGTPGVPADGEFGRATANGVFAFQRAHGLDLTGMIGGGSWPLLAVPVRVGQGGEAERAVQALLAGPGAWRLPQGRLPDVVQGVTWQQLLGTA